jgi:hypothetical protein
MGTGMRTHRRPVCLCTLWSRALAMSSSASTWRARDMVGEVSGYGGRCGTLAHVAAVYILMPAARSNHMRTCAPRIGVCLIASLRFTARTALRLFPFRQSVRRYFETPVTHHHHVWCGMWRRS